MDKYFTHFISRSGGEEAKRRLAYASWFCDTVPSTEFDGDEFLFYEYLSYSVRLGAVVTAKYFDVWLGTELRQILHRTNVRVPGCEAMRFEDPAVFENAPRTTKDVMLDNFRILSAMESDVEDFVVETSAYFEKRRNERLTQILMKTFEIVNDTGSSEEASDYIVDQTNAVKDIYDPDNLEDLEDTDVERNPTGQMELITDYGLPAIDKDSGGIYTTQLVDVEAQSGAGKTRFALGSPCYIALTKYKHNVLYFTLEQTKQEIESMLVARHVFELFHIFITDKVINTNKIPEEHKKTYEAARYDLFESGKYGKFVCVETTLYIESFVSKIKTLDKLKGPFQLICIDYMGMMESNPPAYKRAPTEYEIIKEAFKLFKRFCRKCRKAGLSLSQFNRDGVTAGKNDKEITTDMAQGGLAVFRNTDYNIAISMSDTMKLQQRRRFSQPKVRSSAGFPPFIADTRLGVCWFNQIATKEV